MTRLSHDDSLAKWPTTSHDGSPAKWPTTSHDGSPAKWPASVMMAVQPEPGRHWISRALVGAAFKAVNCPTGNEQRQSDSLETVQG